MLHCSLAVHQETGESMTILLANRLEWEDSVSFGQQPIRCLQIAMHVNESDGGLDGGLAVRLLVADSSCRSIL